MSIQFNFENVYVLSIIIIVTLAVDLENVCKPHPHPSILQNYAKNFEKVLVCLRTHTVYGPFFLDCLWLSWLFNKTHWKPHFKSIVKQNLNQTMKLCLVIQLKMLIITYWGVCIRDFKFQVIFSIIVKNYFTVYYW